MEVNLNPANRPEIREALQRHAFDQNLNRIAGARDDSAKRTETFIREIVRLRTMLADRGVFAFEIRLYACGQDAEPLPASEQPLLFTRLVEGYVGKLWEFYEATGYPLAESERSGLVPSTPTLLALSEKQGERDDYSSDVYWNADRTGPCCIAYLRMPLFEIPVHGLRLTWERVYG